MTNGNGAAWIARAEREGASRDEALAAFDSFGPVPLEEMTGRWRGGGLPTGHPLDGLHEAYGWYGKEFRDADNVFPLLFRRGGRIVALDPARMPIGLVARLRPHRLGWTRHGFALGSRLAVTTKPGARLRMVEYRGVPSAAMIYDRQPIVDHFRQAAPGLLLGLMDLRDSPPFFFTLRRE